MTKIRCLLVFVYRHGQDCTNHGYTEEHDMIYVACSRGPDVLEHDHPALFKVKKGPFNDGYKCLVPYLDCPPNMVGWMNGGNIAYTSDSRFAECISPLPLPIHDRCETQAQYDALSR